MNLLRLFLLSLVFVLLISAVSAKVIISEIMYAPTSEMGGSTNEWIELYNPEDTPVDLNKWNFSELTGDKEIKFHPISNGTIPSKGYLVLARNDTKFKNYFDVDCPVIKVSFGYGLNNEGDNISLINSNGELVDSVSYIASLTNGNNSLQLLDEWREGIPTPGKSNSCDEDDEENETENNETQESINQTQQNNETNNTENQTQNNTESDGADDTDEGDEEKNLDAEKITSNAVKLNSSKAPGENKTANNEQKKVIYQSKNEKMKTASIYLLIGLLVLLIIFFIKHKI